MQVLVEVIKEAGADGIYLSVQSIQDNRVSAEIYKEIIAPSEFVLGAATRPRVTISYIFVLTRPATSNSSKIILLR